MPQVVPPLGFCSRCLDHDLLWTPALTNFEGTALCEACNALAYTAIDADLALGAAQPPPYTDDQEPSDPGAPAVAAV